MVLSLQEVIVPADYGVLHYFSIIALLLGWSILERRALSTGTTSASFYSCDDTVGSH